MSRDWVCCSTPQTPSQTPPQTPPQTPSQTPTQTPPQTPPQTQQRNTALQTTSLETQGHDFHIESQQGGSGRLMYDRPRSPPFVIESMRPENCVAGFTLRLIGWNLSWGRKNRNDDAAAASVVSCIPFEASVCVCVCVCVCTCVYVCAMCVLCACRLVRCSNTQVLSPETHGRKTRQCKVVCVCVCVCLSVCLSVCLCNSTTTSF